MMRAHWELLNNRDILNGYHFDVIQQLSSSLQNFALEICCSEKCWELEASSVRYLQQYLWRTLSEALSAACANLKSFTLICTHFCSCSYTDFWNTDGGHSATAADTRESLRWRDSCYGTHSNMCIDQLTTVQVRWCSEFCSPGSILMHTDEDDIIVRCLLTIFQRLCSQVSLP